ncbi:MafI family immunity protein [Streptomyces sp. CC228A]|uniref:MafI family immunity protein n=1 Tax=Streptomyces sp. CC228A TaxID=2898186 RepID=UPI001F1B6B69|nr:MafI family immunity protein [Streptomyces sp. CC228A]
MTVDPDALRTGWNRTHSHLAAARTHLASLPGADLSTPAEFLEYNELGLAFDGLVDLAVDLDLPLAFWQHMDRAAREMRLYSDALHKAASHGCHRCLRRLAAASEPE